MDNRTGVVTRFLSRSERRVATNEEQTPLVFEAGRRVDTEFLCEFVNSNSQPIVQAAEKHGAVLLRGFSLTNEHDFERVVLAIRGMRGIRDVFLSEPGRDRVEGTQFVLHTNTLNKTGGTLELGRFHTENYFMVDVPRFISFYCQKPSLMGGETGLINMVRLFEFLPEALKHKLLETTCWTGNRSLEEVSKRYGIDLEEAEVFCRSVGLEVTVDRSGRTLMLFKPSVMLNPRTNERSLQVNFKPFRGLRGLLLKEFLPDFSGPQWVFHRLYWKFPQLKLYRSMFRHPVVAMRALLSPPTQSAARGADRHSPAVPPGPRLDQMFSKADLESLARGMRQFYSSFIWRRGDILLVDNCKMAHAGMAGFGSRELKAMICNALPLNCIKDAPGMQTIQNAAVETIGARLQTFINSGVESRLAMSAARQVD